MAHDPIAAIMMKMKPRGEGPPEEDGSDEQAGLQAAAMDLIDAIHAKDPMAVVDAFGALASMVDDDGGDEGEGESSPPPFPPKE